MFRSCASGREGGGRIRGVARALARRTTREAKPTYYMAGACACGFALAPPEAHGLRATSEVALLTAWRLKPRTRQSARSCLCALCLFFYLLNTSGTSRFENERRVGLT